MIEIDGVAQNVEITELRPGSIQVVGVDRWNPPDRADEITQVLLARTEGSSEPADLKLQVRFEWNPRRVNLGWLRVAYLGVFAALGYQWAAQPFLDPIRLQLSRPDAEIVPNLTFRSSETSGHPWRLLFIDRGPLIGLTAVAMGDCTCLLPGLKRGIDVLNDFNASELSLSGRELGVADRVGACARQSDMTTALGSWPGRDTLHCCRLCSHRSGDGESGVLLDAAQVPFEDTR